MVRLLFVCLGNICRSPGAEAVMNEYVNKEGLTDLVQCDSAGILGYHMGERADRRMRHHAQQRGYRVDSISRKFNPETDFDRFDLIIGMDHQNIRDLRSMAATRHQMQKIHLMTDFCCRIERSEVPDPYYGGSDGFELVLDLLEDACGGLIEQIKSEELFGFPV